MDLEYSFRGKHIAAIGEWLDENMPNPLLPEPQRWTIGYADDGYRCGIHFADDMDATLFALRWTGYEVRFFFREESHMVLFALKWSR